MSTVLISVTFIDHEGDTRTVPTYWDDTDVTTLAEAQAVCTGLETLLRAVTGTDIEEFNITFNQAPGQAPNPSDGYPIHTGATLSFLNSDGVGDSFFVPGILESLIQNKLVLNQNAMATLITAFTTATGVGANNARISSRGSGSLWNEFRIGKRSNRKS